MKKIIGLLLGLSIFVFTCHAQNKPDKHKYDVKSYTYKSSDHYNPNSVLIASVLIPGLGQMICDEGIKGLIFLSGYTVGLALIISGLKMELQTTLPEPNWGKVMPIAKTRIRIGLASAASFWIWSAFDAPRTAKIQNLKFREKNGMTGVVNFRPYLSDPSLLAVKKMPVGFSLNIIF